MKKQSFLIGLVAACCMAMFPAQSFAFETDAAYQLDAVSSLYQAIDAHGVDLVAPEVATVGPLSAASAEAKVSVKQTAKFGSHPFERAFQAPGAIARLNYEVAWRS